jgi:predicted Zn finger-like uncharacterized protein
LFTQCSKCETVFRLSADALRAAGGQVRCGRCGEVFSALARLAEEPNAFAGGESPLDLETRADGILQTAATLPPGLPAPEEFDDFSATGVAPPGVEIAHLQVLDWHLDEQPASGTDEIPADPDLETSMEFTLPPGELDRIFVESRPRTLRPVPFEAPADTDAQSVVQRAAHPEAPLKDDAAAVEDVGRGVTGTQVSEEVRRDMLAGFAQAPLPEIEAPIVRRRRPFVWLAAAVVLCVMLAVQVIHGNREWLIAHQPVAAGLRMLYSKFGLTLPAPANLSAYELRQWGVTGDPGANGTLRVRASILNTANQLQPYPLLRVTLANRFGARIGTRDFGPAEYLGKPPARMLAPGERVDATLDILDPGKDAEGFEIDVCLRGTDGHIACADDAAVQTKQ